MNKVVEVLGYFIYDIQITQKFAFDRIYHDRNLQNHCCIDLQWGKILSEKAFLFSRAFFKAIQGLLNLDGRNSQKYLHQTKADFLTLIMLHKLTQSL